METTLKFLSCRESWREMQRNFLVFLFICIGKNNRNKFFMCIYVHVIFILLMNIKTNIKRQRIKRNIWFFFLLLHVHFKISTNICEQCTLTLKPPMWPKWLIHNFFYDYRCKIVHFYRFKWFFFIKYTNKSLRALLYFYSFHFNYLRWKFDALRPLAVLINFSLRHTQLR